MLIVQRSDRPGGSSIDDPAVTLEGRTRWTFTSRNDIKFEDLREVAVIGSGSFGMVRMVTFKDTGEVFALKSMWRDQIKHLRAERNVMDEKLLLSIVQNPFVVQLYNTYKNSKKLYMLMEIVQGGELYRRIHPINGSKDGISDDAAKFYACGVVAALAHLHSRDIMYRDLKPENVLLDDTGYVKICDFGFAKIVAQGERTYTLCGTPEYLAPEIVLGRGHRTGADWWALGILIYEMLAGYTPYEDVPQCREDIVMKNIIQHDLRFPVGGGDDEFTPASKALVRGLLQPQISDRFGCRRDLEKEIRESDWFEDYNWVRTERGNSKRDSNQI